MSGNLAAIKNGQDRNSTESALKEPTDTKEGFYKGTIKVGHLVALDMAPLFLAKEAGYF